jgi:riboflavin kinase / FMN adenylyltransferase
MRMYRGFGALPPGFGPAVVAMGNFDGVHLGHRSVLDSMVRAARERGVLATIVTFHPHPLRILAPERAPVLIQSMSDRLACLEETGVDAVILVPFTRALADVPAEEFVREFLVRRLQCVELRVGGDARFGKGRAGDVALLQRFADEGLFDVRISDAVRVGVVRASSSEVRRRVLAGDVAGAATLLGRPFSLAGEVVTGAARGRRMGFPTANLLPDTAMRPAPGVYAAIGSGPGFRAPAAVHVGPIPTFDVASSVVEAHLVGFEGELVGTRMRLEFVQRLRAVTRFADVESLKARIAQDIQETLESVRAHEGIR